MRFPTLLAYACNDGALDPANNVGAVVELLDQTDDMLNVVFRGVRFHYDDHAGNPLKSWRLKPAARFDRSSNVGSVHISGLHEACTNSGRTLRRLCAADAGPSIADISRFRRRTALRDSASGIYPRRR